LTELLGFFDLSSISIYNEAKTMAKGISWTIFHKVLKISLCYEFAWFSVRQTLKYIVLYDEIHLKYCRDTVAFG
jgi:hypothetical protein